LIRPQRRPELMQLDLPSPSPTAREHSAALVSHVAALIRERDGWLGFADYMQQVLYAPGLGYYSAGASKFGEAGDFVTAPEISPLFSRCVAGQLAEVMQQAGIRTVIEPGAGTGVMAADMLLEFERLAALPDEYLILEPSADLQSRQAATLQDRAPHLADRVRWLEQGLQEPQHAIVVGNEVMDALPVHRFRIEQGQVRELGVSMQDDQFVWSSRPAGEFLAAAVAQIMRETGTEFPEGYESEVCLQLPGWVQAVSEWLHDGLVLLFDYGFTRREYYLPERSTGTLRCYYRHRAHEDVFLWPGLQDVTAWVDFSWLARAAQAAGLQVAGYTNQANFLLAAGVEERVAVTAADPQAQVQLAQGLRQLLLPGEMGESIKVMALTRGAVQVPAAMTGRDFRNRL